MSEPEQSDLSSDAAEERAAGGESTGDTEEVDALIVPDDELPVASEPAPVPVRASTRAVAPAVQAAAVAATGFVAGAAVVSLARRRHSRSIAKTRKGRRSIRRGASGRRESSGVAGELVQIVGSRSLLVDVHLLGGSGRDR